MCYRSLERGVAARAVLPVAVALGACGGEDHAPRLDVQPTRYQAETCEPRARTDEDPVPFFEWSPLADANYYDCIAPREGEGTMSFHSAFGTEATVTGSSAELTFDWAGVLDSPDRQLVVWEANRSGFYTLPLDGMSAPLDMNLRINTGVPTGNYGLAMAISEGSQKDASGRPVVGEVLVAPIYIVAVGSGDVQINLHWDTTADLDLWVEDPFGNRVWYADTQPSSGGQLDLDSYPACNTEGDRGRGNENVYWPIGGASRGSYSVYVVMYADCGTYAARVPTNYRVTATTADGLFQVIDGRFVPDDETTGAEVPLFTLDF
jgi:hypothetical protein